jgi:hypothetical protein
VDEAEQGAQHKPAPVDHGVVGEREEQPEDETEGVPDRLGADSVFADRRPEEEGQCERTVLTNGWRTR